MSKLFWILLAVAGGGYRYLRARICAAAGLISRLGQAPGSDGKGALRLWGSLTADPVSRSVADGRFVARSERSLMGRMVAWLVSVARFWGRTQTDLVIELQTSPAADMAGEWNTDVKLVRDMEAAPGIPAASALTASVPLTAEPEMAPLSGVEGAMYAEHRLDALGIAGGPLLIAGGLLSAERMDAGMDIGSSVPVYGTAGPAGAVLTARMIAWALPQWMDASTLYIRQVYETQRDGDVLILH